MIKIEEYTKINTIFQREEKKPRKIIEGLYSTPEIQYLKDNEWVFTEKIDGTNVRAHFDPSEDSIIFSGKTESSQIPSSLVYRLMKIFPRTKFLENNFDAPMTLFGEGYGGKIQDGRNYKPECDFILFDIKIGDFWLERFNIEDIAKKLEVQVVPIVGYGTLNDAIESTRKGFESTFGNFIAEGLVLKPKTELFSRKGERIITKIKHKDFK